MVAATRPSPEAAAAAGMAQRAVEVDAGVAVEMRLFTPADGRPPSFAVVVGGAMGVHQGYYRPFAEWLAGQGAAVATFDYRGTFASRRPDPRSSLRGFDADLYSWARDFDAVIDETAANAPGVPIYVVGHSLGAQLPGMLRNRGRIAGLLGVATGSGYWRDNAPPLKRVVLWFWHVLVPAATWAFGYFPGARLGKVGDLPRGVILQWRRWCMNPRYHVGAEGATVRELFASVRFPVVALSMTDDEMMTERGTHVLVDCYANAPRLVERIAPGDVQARRIGHFGFFRDAFAPTLWTRSLALLQGFQPAKVHP
jgi:predicted alpha/beta hydrolase